MAADDLDLPRLPETLGGDDPDEGTDTEPDPIEELRAEMAALRAEREEERKRFQGTIDSLIQRPAAPGAAPEPKAATIDWNNLPDPVEKPEEFKRALADRQKQAADAMRNELRQEVEQSNRVNRLWYDFRTEYPDLAKKEALATATASAVARELGGINWDNPSAFMQKVAERMKAELNITDDKANPPPRSKPSNRTAGVGAGSKGAGGVASGKDDAPKGFLDQIKKLQLESGLI